MIESSLCVLFARSGLIGNSLGDKMKRKTLLLWASLLVVLALEGCATVRGMGEDVQSLGRAIKRAVSG
jgi:predicted small secreted protein